MRLNYQILSPISETSELNGMKKFAIKNRVLQRDRVLQRRVLERYYCTLVFSSLSSIGLGLSPKGLVKRKRPSVITRRVIARYDCTKL